MLRSVIFALLLAWVNIASAQEQSFPGVDTLEFHVDETGTKQNKLDYINILKSQDKRKIAELFNKTAVYYANHDQLPRSIGYFKTAIDLFKEIGSIKEMCVAINYQATVWYNLFRYEKAIDLYLSSIDYSKSVADHRAVAETYNEIAFVYYNTYRYSPAKQFFLKSISSSRKTKDTLRLSQSNYFIGNIYLDEEKFDSTLFYFSRSLVEDKKRGDTSEITSSLNNIGVVYYRMGNYKHAVKYFGDAVKQNEKSEKIKAIFLNNVGNVYFDQGDFTRALENYTKSIEAKQRTGFEEGIPISEYNIGNVYRKTGKTDLAIKYFNQGLEHADKYQTKDVASRCYLSLSKLYEDNSKDKDAYNYYEKFIKSSYSILLDDDGGQVSEIAEKHERTRREVLMLSHEIQMQKLFSDYDAYLKGREINILREKQLFQRNLNLTYIGILLFLIIAALLILNQYRIKKKASIELARKNENIEKQNITIQEQSDELLLSNRELEKLSIVASETDNAVIIMDADGNFEWVNLGFTKLFGLTYDELVSNVSSNMIGERTPQYIKDKFERCRTNLETVSYELPSVNGNKEPIWVNVTLTPILGNDGRLSKMVSIDADITTIKKAEDEILKQKDEIEKQRDLLKGQTDEILAQKRELEDQKEQLDITLSELKTTQKKLVESEKMAALGNLVAGIAHEINTPVGIGIAASSTMASRTELLEESFTSKKMTMNDLQNYLATTRQSCELILSNLNKTAELVNTFKQVSIDNMTEQKRAFNLNEYLHDIVRSMHPKLKVRKISVEIDCPADIELNSYPSAYYQLVNNFINNSLLHAYEDDDAGKIVIKTFVEKDTFTLIYTDDGKGIPEKNLPRIFEPFFTTHMQSGSGLGMHIAYNLVTQKLGGDIRLESKLGEGVKFTIEIPLKNIQQ